MAASVDRIIQTLNDLVTQCQAINTELDRALANDAADMETIRRLRSDLAALTTVYLSDLTPTAAVNAWGPYERDRSNGENGPADGRPLTIRGTVYPKGLGVHAASSLTYALGGAYSRTASCG
jgi:hypothetical protein